MKTPIRALSFLRALALVAPVAAGCEQQRASYEPIRSNGSSGQASTPDASATNETVVAAGDASASEGLCPRALPAETATCATDERCGYQSTTTELISNRAPGHGDTSCECVEGRWHCQRLVFVGPLAPPEFEFV